MTLPIPSFSFEAVRDIVKAQTKEIINKGTASGVCWSFGLSFGISLLLISPEKLHAPLAAGLMAATATIIYKIFICVVQHLEKKYLKGEKPGSITSLYVVTWVSGLYLADRLGMKFCLAGFLLALGVHIANAHTQSQTPLIGYVFV